MLATTTAITCAAILVGCSSGGGEPQGSGDGSARAGAPTSTPTPTPTAVFTEDALRSAVLTTSELPVGGWTEKPDTSGGDGSGGTTSRDAESPGACAADFSEVVPDGFADVPEVGADWTRESTSSFLSTGVVADPEAAEHVRAIAAAVADCPTDGATYTIDGQQQRITTVPLDLGEWGSVSSCIRYELNSSTSVVGETCMVAGEGFLATVTVGSPYSFGVPEDDELRTIVDAAVRKAERALA
ncbi:hypothetical protein DEI99_006400 [Curtobacterium sp. MCLR17_036]|uniref:hypothetical protein n=1 Tax=Curtobacterium sp. MCLR17_036 TaxID=2175620 RepID=UPI000DA9890F|nr:hypothetical protein [Curtobacterium sp. MCLR17_036]WIE66161.1 hypothetical protein DEI99_006400 [Curtobacterium sp. MCLR17_036]